MHFMQRIRIHKYGRVYYTCIWSVYVCIIWIKYSTNLCDDGKSEEKYACICVYYFRGEILSSQILRCVMSFSCIVVYYPTRRFPRITFD